MSLYAGDCITFARDLMATPGNAATVRWSDQQLLRFLDRSNKDTVQQLRFPESRLALTSTGAQEYQLPDTHELYRVYLNGQIIVEVPGGINTLQGDQSFVYDQSGQGSVPAGGGGATGGAQQQPQWAIQQPTTYPFINNWGTPAPYAQPWQTGQRPRYYHRGGYLGFVPAPATGATITVDAVLVPPPIVTTAQLLLAPDQFFDSLVWGLVTFCYMADDTDRSAEKRNYAMTMREKAIRELRDWKRQFAIEDKQLQMLNYRGAFQYGNNRVGNGGGWDLV